MLIPQVVDDGPEGERAIWEHLRARGYDRAYFEAFYAVNKAAAMERQAAQTPPPVYVAPSGPNPGAALCATQRPAETSG